MRRFLLVGASSGIGLALSTLLDGEQIVNFSRTPCDVAGVVNYSVDTSDAAQVRDAVSALRRDDLLPTDMVYLAGCSMCAPFATTKEEHCRKLFEVNFWGAIELLQALLPSLENGHVVFVGSMAGAAPIPYDPFYSASKAALMQFVLALACELPRCKLTAVLPGGTRTGFTAKRLVYDDEHCGEQTVPCRNAERALAEIEQNGQEPIAVAKAIRRALYSKRPPLILPTGINKLTYAASRLLPPKALTFILKKTFGTDGEERV